MIQSRSIVHTKLAPPRPQKYTMARPRLTARLLEARDHRLTIVQAGTGYGKSTALAGLAGEPFPFIWYRLDPEDTDPQRLLAHLIRGFADALPGLSDPPEAALEEWSANRAAVSWSTVVDSLINECCRASDADTPLFLALDDTHHLNDAAEPLRIIDRLIGLAPANLHVILSTRQPVALPSLLGWRVKGEVLEIGQDELAFMPAEIDTLFRRQFGHALTLEQAALLVEKVEGWPIALHLVWRNLHKSGGVTMAEAIAQLSGSAGDLFAYLTHEVLAQQPDDLQRFLRQTSVLRQMTAGSCNHLRRSGDSRAILDYLLENGLFVVDLGDGQLRYHNLFRELLYGQLSPAESEAANRDAAVYYQQQGEAEESLYHWLAAGAHEEAAGALDSLGREMVRAGRLDTLAGWIAALPADTLAAHPPLLSYLGDIARLHSRFEQALGWYEQAGRSSRALGDNLALGQSLRGRARVYLDTVNPNEAEQLLQEALRLSDGLDDRENRAHLYELMAENLINQGRAEEAKRYQADERALRHEGPSQVELPVRILLRTGRLVEARRLLEEQAERERREPVLRPRAHRETLLLLSLILAYQGEQEAAMQTAVEGTARGQALQSEFVTAVGFARQGHAWSLMKNEYGYRQATRCHEETVRYSEKLDVPRLKVEAYWGLTQSYGYLGEIATAGQMAEKGIEIAAAVGDEWILAGIRAVLGASYVLAGRAHEAAAPLEQAFNGFRESSDTYGEAVTRLWQCLMWRATGDIARLERSLGALLLLCRTHGYGYLFLRSTLLGPPDTRMLVPLLLFARDAGQGAAYARSLLDDLGLGALELHPGYRLDVRVLGTLRLWRGAEEVAEREWQRKKARQLFLLLVTWRGRTLHREQICDLLWPELAPDEAERDFKIAYSALCDVLEPARKKHAPSAFFLRRGLGIGGDNAYGLRPEADVGIDAAEFETAAAEGDRLLPADPEAAARRYRAALALYRGDYLEGYPYDEWLFAERERLAGLRLRTAGRLAEALLRLSHWEEVIEVCEIILARDSCREDAYRQMMTAHERLGNGVEVTRTFERCARALREDCGVEPAAETVALLERLAQRKAA